MTTFVEIYGFDNTGTWAINVDAIDAVSTDEEGNQQILTRGGRVIRVGSRTTVHLSDYLHKLESN